MAYAKPIPPSNLEGQDSPARPAVKISAELAREMLNQFGSDFLQKTPGRITALKLDFDFTCETLTGPGLGHRGEYLIRDGSGEMMIITQDHLENHFRPVRKPVKPKTGG
jgi:hypothetical protein